MFFDNKNKPFSPIAEGSPLLLLAFCGCGETGVGPPYFFIMMKKKDFFEGRKSDRAAGSNNPRLIGEVINDLLNGQAPFARACRHRTGRAWTGQDGAGNACSGCTRSDSTWTENMRTESAGAGRTWTGLYPNTELDVDLKLVKQEQGRMELGEYLDGMITRDGEDHFTFVENATEQRKATRRNPSIYMGQWINVKRRADGTVYPTFKRTKGIGAGKLGDYAVNTTCELLMVAGKHEAAMALAEVEGFDLSELFATDRGLGEEEDFGGKSVFASGRGLGKEEDFGEE